MAIFNVNGKETDSLAEAIEFCRGVWGEAKADAVLEQHRTALAKPSQLDIERAAMGGIQPDMSRANARAAN